jgi:hypothetical protein
VHTGFLSQTYLCLYGDDGVPATVTLRHGYPPHQHKSITTHTLLLSIIDPGMTNTNERLQIAAAFAAGAAAAAGLGLLMLQPRLRTRTAVYVQKPHPGWTPLQKQQPPHDPDIMHEVDPSVVDKVSIYPLVISTIVPRPIGERLA